MTKEQLLEDITTLQKQGQEAQQTIMKVEGALQFAHYLLSKFDEEAKEVSEKKE